MEVTYSKSDPIIETFNNGVKIALHKADGSYRQVSYYERQPFDDVYFVLNSAGDVVLSSESYKPSLMFYQTHGLYMAVTREAGKGEVMFDKNGNVVKLPFDPFGIYYHQKQDCFVIERSIADEPTQVCVFDGTLNFHKVEPKRGILVVDYLHMMVKKEYLEFRNVEIKLENRVQKKLFKSINYTVKVADDWIEYYSYNKNTHGIEFIKEEFKEKRFIERV